MTNTKKTIYSHRDLQDATFCGSSYPVLVRLQCSLQWRETQLQVKVEAGQRVSPAHPGWARAWLRREPGTRGQALHQITDIPTPVRWPGGQVQPGCHLPRSPACCICRRFGQPFLGNLLGSGAPPDPTWAGASLIYTSVGTSSARLQVL